MRGGVGGTGLESGSWENEHSEGLCQEQRDRLDRDKGMKHESGTLSQSGSEVLTSTKTKQGMMEKLRFR